MYNRMYLCIDLNNADKKRNVENLCKFPVLKIKSIY